MENRSKMRSPEALDAMLMRYNLNSVQDHKNALLEVIQEIALLGLWRSKFFEKAVFYGGTALRILYGLDRFSEDLDFTLLTPQKNFDISKYEKAIQLELNSMGFSSEVEKKVKTKQSAIESAFIKLNTIEHLLHIGMPKSLSSSMHKEARLKIRLEVDTDPPKDKATEETKLLLLPIPFSVKSLRKEDLFAGKAHAALCRQWKGRVKGRDWYDLVWFISRGVSLNLYYLKKRMEQSGHWPRRKALKHKDLIELFEKKIDSLDISSAKEDMVNFAMDRSQIELWSKEFFREVIQKIKTIPS
ncbi:MAG: hypothetical protein S4CHLAM7_13460 [Chlamydiae bacterium]|nr:hypothetical protein [Chlamydiota bacterium]